ncbi:hypothetical protein [Streptomyces fulvorobeus]|uniref:Uncharacterized protein n=1 Tax=Streptomyces fulvorobeus TaxID=284028 RepID=A0A7J0CE00_9ACTN|nr:hypothetical protein [Streptomyces fulvorobeus]NYE43459.1 hypothetical protein [Streptomyces fulvorobeus]GFM99926.1 hypothetical protein Sfulv_47370 [Streptomyces fulvorobeus]
MTWTPADDVDVSPDTTDAWPASRPPDSAPVLTVSSGERPAEAEPRWLMAANVVRWRRYGKGGQELRPGTRVCRGGSKVYVIGYRPGGSDVLTAIGRGRHTGTYVTLELATRHLHTFRAALVRSPAVLLRDAENGSGRDWDGPEGTAERAARFERQAAEERGARWPGVPHPAPCRCHECLALGSA